MRFDGHVKITLLALDTLVNMSGRKDVPWAAPTSKVGGTSNSGRTLARRLRLRAIAVRPTSATRRGSVGHHERSLAFRIRPATPPFMRATGETEWDAYNNAVSLSEPRRRGGYGRAWRVSGTRWHGAPSRASWLPSQSSRRARNWTPLWRRHCTASRIRSRPHTCCGQRSTATCSSGRRRRTPAQHALKVRHRSAASSTTTIHTTTRTWRPRNSTTQTTTMPVPPITPQPTPPRTPARS